MILNTRDMKAGKGGEGGAEKTLVRLHLSSTCFVCVRGGILLWGGGGVG